MNTLQFYERIIEDLESVPLTLVSQRGHGKSTSIKTLAQLMRSEKGSGVVFKVFDVSQSWFHCAPVEWRQFVTAEGIASGGVQNQPNTVYEIGSLSKEDRRSFVSSIIYHDFTTRYNLARTHGVKAVRSMPLIVYVLEEANCYLDSRSLLKNDESAKILNDFVSIGRNFGLSFIAIVTRCKGELATGVRERTNYLFGRISGASELNLVRQLSNKQVKNTVKSIPRFHFVYWSGYESGPFRIPDLCRSVPSDLVIVNPFTHSWTSQKPKPKLDLVTKALAVVQIFYSLLALAVMIPIFGGMIWIFFFLF